MAAQIEAAHVSFPSWEARGLYGPHILFWGMYMALRTAIFVDGANFRGNLRNFQFSAPDDPEGRTYRLEERHFNWKEFFGGVIAKFDAATGLEHQLVRVHWYFAQSISPWLSNENEIQRLAQRITVEYTGIPNLSAELIVSKARAWYERERAYFERLHETTFEDIQRKTDFLEFRYVGQYQVHPFRVHRLEPTPDGSIRYQGVQVGEKGVDIGIAVDMIAKMPHYDTAILVSGDADFLPVVAHVKDHLKYVHQFSVAKVVPPQVRHLSPFLRGKVDCFESFDEHELLTQFLNRNSSIPPAILAAIDDRIAELARW